MEFLYSMTEAFKDLGNTQIKRLSIVNGIVWAFIWFGIGVVFYEPLLRFSTSMINLLPFTFVKKSGAEFILMISWLQTILVTIGIFFALFNQVLSKKIIPILVSFIIAIFWFIVYFVYQDSILIYLEKLIKIFPFESVEEAVSNVLAMFVFYSFYVASIYISFLALSGKILEKLQTEEYPEVEVTKEFSFLKLFWIMFRDLMIFIVALFVLYPLLFVPFVNVVIIITLWVFLIKSSLLEVVFMIFGKEQLNKKEIYSFSIMSVIFNFLPIVNLFAPAFGVLSVYHYVMEKKLDKK